MRVDRLFGVNTFSLDRWVRGGRTLEFVHEFIESGMDFGNFSIEFGLDVVHFCMHGQNVSIYLGLKGSKVSTQFLIGFFLVGGRHEGMRGGSTNKKEKK
jgi:hypothetical protein